MGRTGPLLAEEVGLREFAGQEVPYHALHGQVHIGGHVPVGALGRHNPGQPLANDLGSTGDRLDRHGQECDWNVQLAAPAFPRGCFISVC